MDADVLTVEGAAAVLGVSAWTVRAQARAGRLPGRKVGKEWRFSRRAILDWLGGRARENGSRELGEPAADHHASEPDQSDEVMTAFRAVLRGDATPSDVARLRAAWGEGVVREDGTIDSLAVALAFAAPLGPEFSAEDPHRMTRRGDGWFDDE